MRAVVWTRYGPPEALQLREIPKPSPRAHELLIRIRATTVSAGDCELRALNFSFGLRLLVRAWMGFTRPRRKVLGQELAGEVEAVGPKVTHFLPGDQVFATTGLGFGAYAEYLCLPEVSKGRALAIKPANMTFEEAAAVPTGGLEALHFLRRAGDLRGRSVLVNGAAGGIGLFAVQLAKYFGADVTGVDLTEKLELMRSIGADRVIDCTREGFTQTGATYAVIFDAIGKSPFAASLAALNDQGRYLLGNPRFSTMLRGRLTPARGGRKVIFGASAQRAEDLAFLRQLIEEGRIRSVVDRRFALDQVAEAHRYFERGLARGRVVITVSGRDTAGPGPTRVT
jgi:NADPH:quinone reductase-like Zn-dependent oxidoreductase